VAPFGKGTANSSLVLYVDATRQLFYVRSSFSKVIATGGPVVDNVYVLVFRQPLKTVSSLVSVSILENVLYDQTFASGSNAWNLSPAEPWTLGGSGNNVYGTPQYTCSNFVVHEVRIYNQSLSNEEVTAVRSESPTDSRCLVGGRDERHVATILSLPPPAKREYALNK
jgi:hypothetical protein